jgi:hypothetical protein
MVIILDISNPFQAKAGYMRSDLGSDAIGWRVWWLWFAITYSPLSDYEYHNRIRSPNCVWVCDDT